MGATRVPPIPQTPSKMGTLESGHVSGAHCQNPQKLAVELVLPKLLALRTDPEVASGVEDALDDIKWYMRAPSRRAESASWFVGQRSVQRTITHELRRYRLPGAAIVEVLVPCAPAGLARQNRRQPYRLTSPIVKVKSLQP